MKKTQYRERNKGIQGGTPAFYAEFCLSVSLFVERLGIGESFIHCKRYKNRKLQKENPRPDRSTWGSFFGSPYGIRTRVTGVRGRRPRPLDERAIEAHFFKQDPKN